MTSVYLRKDYTLNSRTKKVRCSPPHFHCKRIDCETCMILRRDWIVKNGVELAMQNDLNVQLIVAFPWWPKIRRKGHETDVDSLQKLISNASILAKKMSGVKARPYIRFIAIGKKGCPHFHFIVSNKTADKIEKICKKIWSSKVVIEKSSIYNVKELLGYFFDQNFYPTYFHPDKVKGTRLISGSRPMKCGFPNKKQICEMYNVDIGKMESKFEMNNLNWNGTESCFSNGASR